VQDGVLDFKEWAGAPAVMLCLCSHTFMRSRFLRARHGVMTPQSCLHAPGMLQHIAARHAHDYLRSRVRAWNRYDGLERGQRAYPAARQHERQRLRAQPAGDV
jgi:hypothetical protein